MNLPKNYKLKNKDIAKIVQDFTTGNFRLWKLHKYLVGKHQILLKTVEDKSKPNNKLVYNFPRYIVENFSSYMVGNQIVYNSNNKDGLDKIMQIMDYNDSGASDLQIAMDMNTFGVAYELQWIDEDGEIRFSPVSPLDIIVIYDDTIERNILYAIRIIRNVDIYDNVTHTLEVYDKEKVRYYKSDELFTNVRASGSVDHYFGDVPVIEYVNNRDKRGSFEDVLSLVDAYEKISSSEADDYEAFCDAYMALYGVSADEEDLAQMKENRILLLDQESRAEYLIKNVNKDQIKSIKDELSSNIHKISMCPDFTSSELGSASGIALEFKLLGFTDLGTIKIRNMKKGIQKRLELICNILSKTDGSIEYTDFDVVYTPNLPQDQLNITNMITQLKGIVSDETLLGLLPFIEDVQMELNKVRAQPTVTEEVHTDVEIANPNGIQNSGRTANAGLSE